MQTTTTAGTYPASFTFQPAEKVANWRAIVNPILAIPHLIIQAALGYASQAVAIISWFAILFTARHPDGLASLSTFYLRWRVRAVAYSALLRDEYPPFGDGDYAASLRIEGRAIREAGRWG